MPLRSIRLPLMLALLIATVAVLAGCGSNTPPEVPRSVVITAPPVPVGTLVAGCTASGLEAWYEVATSLSDRFAVESLAALDLPPDRLPDAISRQSDLLDRMLAEPVPECAGAAQAAFRRFARIEASAIVGIYASFVYLASLPGGWIADKWLGLRRAASRSSDPRSLRAQIVGWRGPLQPDPAL